MATQQPKKVVVYKERISMDANTTVWWSRIADLDVNNHFIFDGYYAGMMYRWVINYGMK